MNPIILIDFSWLYNKYYFVAKQKESKDIKELLYNMLIQFLNRISNCYKGSQIYVAIDSSTKSLKNYNLNKNYKQNRNKEIKKEVYENIKEIICKLKENLSLSFHFVKAKGYEADHVIAFLTKMAYGCSPVIIFSGDKDLIQLTGYQSVFISDKFEQGKFIIKSNKELFDKFKNSKGENFTRISYDIKDLLKYRVLKGDPSDNLPPVFHRIKDKDIISIIQNYWTFHDELTSESIINIINNIKEDNEVLGNKLQENKGTWLINYEIMNLYNIKGIKVIELK